MRWLLLGFAFTMMIVLGVFTVAVKSANVRCRKQIEELLGDASIRTVEQDRLAHSLRQATGRERLLVRWQNHQRRAEGLVQ